MLMLVKAGCLITEGSIFRTLLQLLKTSITIMLEITIPQVYRISGYHSSDNEDYSLLEQYTT
jgi:hypothetical protein